MDADARLAAAAGGAARCLADSAGLSDETILELQASVLSACKYCFALHVVASHHEVQLHRLADRIEVELPLPAERTPAEKGKLSWPGIDRVGYEVRQNSVVLRLTKFFPAVPGAES